VVEERADVLERVAARVPAEGTDEHRAGREEQEDQRVREERERSDPCEREAPPAG
jgi:hypothetical protein